MRQYVTKTEENQVLEAVVCNCCGQAIQKTDEERLYEHLSVTKQWGFLSPFDNELHSFDLCAECYSQITGGFKIPVK